MQHWLASNATFRWAGTRCHEANFSQVIVISTPVEVGMPKCNDSFVYLHQVCSCGMEAFMPCMYVSSIIVPLVTNIDHRNTATSQGPSGMGSGRDHSFSELEESRLESRILV